MDFAGESGDGSVKVTGDMAKNQGELSPTSLKLSRHDGE
jgi:hypothetical protein